MSRSRKTRPIIGVTTCASEKKDKSQAHRKLRAAVRSAVAADANALPTLRDVSDVWSFGKDGKRWLNNLGSAWLRK